MFFPRKMGIKKSNQPLPIFDSWMLRPGKKIWAMNFANFR